MGIHVKDAAQFAKVRQAGKVVLIKTTSRQAASDLAQAGQTASVAASRTIKATSVAASVASLASYNGMACDVATQAETASYCPIVSAWPTVRKAKRHHGGFRGIESFEASNELLEALESKPPQSPMIGAQSNPLSSLGLEALEAFQAKFESRLDAIFSLNSEVTSQAAKLATIQSLLHGETERTTFVVKAACKRSGGLSEIYVVPQHETTRGGRLEVDLDTLPSVAGFSLEAFHDTFETVMASDLWQRDWPELPHQSQAATIATLQSQAATLAASIKANRLELKAMQNNLLRDATRFFASESGLDESGLALLQAKRRIELLQAKAATYAKRGETSKKAATRLANQTKAAQALEELEAAQAAAKALEVEVNTTIATPSRGF